MSKATTMKKVRKSNVRRKVVKPVTSADVLVELRTLASQVGRRFGAVDEVLMHIVHNMATKDQVHELDVRVSTLESTTRELTTSVQAFAGRLQEFEMEHGSFVVQTRRYEKWFNQFSRILNSPLEV